jgi:hypothetical protein
MTRRILTTEGGTILVADDGTTILISDDSTPVPAPQRPQHIVGIEFQEHDRVSNGMFITWRR